MSHGFADSECSFFLGGGLPCFKFYGLCNTPTTHDDIRALWV